MELKEFHCHGDKCKIKWKALPDSNQLFCSSCSNSKQRWVKHDRELAEKKPKIEAKPHVPKIEQIKRVRKIKLRGESERPSWNQRILAKKFKKDPDVVCCPKCSNFYKSRVNQFGTNKINIISNCPRCGEDGSFTQQLQQI